MKLLAIEDDEKTQELVRRGLGDSGFVVDVIRNGIDGLVAAQTQVYSLIVLDTVLPELDGFELLAKFRKVDRQTPVIMLSTRDSAELRVRGLTGGADDFMTRPFAISELVARVKAVLKRSASVAPDTLEVEDLSMDPKRFQVTRAGAVVELTSKEFLLLELLLRHRGEVLTRSFIAERVWDMDFDADSNIVEVNIRRLRQKIDDPHVRKLIYTVRGRGYVVR